MGHCSVEMLHIPARYAEIICKKVLAPLEPVIQQAYRFGDKLHAAVPDLDAVALLRPRDTHGQCFPCAESVDAVSQSVRKCHFPCRTWRCPSGRRRLSDSRLSRGTIYMAKPNIRIEMCIFAKNYSGIYGRQRLEKKTRSGIFHESGF